ncbi:MAG: TetR/AcrR family transcriptional regulator [Actinomycetaceae bacterium]
MADDDTGGRGRVRGGGRGRGRGRPRRGDEPALTGDVIAARALEIAGAEGFAAVTMQRLADELGVTPRALYNHVDGRQEIVDRVAALLVRSIPPPRLDPQRWRPSLRRAYEEGRAAYRAAPRALLISLEETLTSAEVDPGRIAITEEMLQFFVDIGLTLPEAVAARSSFLLDLFSFALLVDHPWDTGDEATRAILGQPTPGPWLDAHPEIPAPLSRQAAAAPTRTPDDTFEALVDMRLAAIEKMLEGR